MPDLSAIGEAGVVKLVVRDKKNETSNTHEIVVGETTDTFEFNFKVENIKVIPGSYDVVVSKSGLSKFTSKDRSRLTSLLLNLISYFKSRKWQVTYRLPQNTQKIIEADHQWEAKKIFEHTSLGMR